MGTPNFKDDLARGELGVSDMLNLPGFTPGCGTVEDIFFMGVKIELKTDFTNLPTFFMEVYSNMAMETFGGPWRAWRDGCRFLYYFREAREAYLFPDVQRLLDRLEILAEMGKASWKEVPNKGYTSGGYSVRIEEVSDLFIRFKVGNGQGN